MDIRLQICCAVIFILCFTIILLLIKIKELKDKLPLDLKALGHMRLDKALIMLHKHGVTLVAVNKESTQDSKNNRTVED